MKTLVPCIALSALLAGPAACKDDSGGKGQDIKAFDLQQGQDLAADLASGDAPPVPEVGAADLPRKDALTGEAGPCKPGLFEVVDGGTGKCVPLPSGVALPVDSSTEAEALKKASGCVCSCEGGWTEESGKWVCDCCVKYPDCSVTVQKKSGKTQCEQFG